MSLAVTCLLPSTASLPMILITRSGQLVSKTSTVWIVTGSLITPSSDGCKVAVLQSFSLYYFFHYIAFKNSSFFNNDFAFVSGFPTKFSAIVWCNKRVLRCNFVDFVASNHAKSGVGRRNELLIKVTAELSAVSGSPGRRRSYHLLMPLFLYEIHPYVMNIFI